MANYLEDPDDFCRECGGSGRVETGNGHGGTVTERCDMCGGTGNKSARITVPIVSMEERLYRIARTFRFAMERLLDGKGLTPDEISALNQLREIEAKRQGSMT
ncbi:MAG: hypothetical protein EP341_00380 [Sphingomonadales bacterium]|nr:MAG: hypothetical protein EP341_00380 [Sphingomonadales bacterium]